MNSLAEELTNRHDKIIKYLHIGYAQWDKLIRRVERQEREPSDDFDDEQIWTFLVGCGYAIAGEDGVATLTKILTGSNYEAPTNPGQDVEVPLGDSVSLIFDNVTEPGTTEMTVTSTGPDPSSSFTIVPSDPPIYYNITTTAVFEDSIEICISYDDTDMSPEVEASLTLMHHDGVEWVDITSSLDTAANVICGISDELSPFVIGRPPFWCGDANSDATVNILDVTYIINYLYKNGPAPVPEEAADADGSGGLNLLDVTYLINYLYKNGPEPIC